MNSIYPPPKKNFRLIHSPDNIILQRTRIAKYFAILLPSARFFTPHDGGITAYECQSFRDSDVLQSLSKVMV